MFIEIWQGKSVGNRQSWFWHFKSKGRVTADSEAFPTKAHAMRAAKGVVNGVVKELKVTPIFKISEIDKKLTCVRWM
jgi:hypothetical protein